MKTSSLALSALLAAASVDPFAVAFVPSTFSQSSLVRSISYNSYVASSVGILSSPVQLNMSSMSFEAENQDDDDEDEDEDDEDEDDDEDLEASLRRRSYSAKSPFTGMKLDPYDPNPVIRRPGKFFKDEADEDVIPDDQLVQTMSAEERKENLAVMRQIQKSDLPDLQLRRDHAGWVEANNDLKRRRTNDPWFGINDRIKEAIQMGESEEKLAQLRALEKQVGGPPEGIVVGPRGYAVHSQIFDVGISSSTAASMLEYEMRQERAARGRAMMAERMKNEEKEQREYEEDLRFPGLREDREAKARRERIMKKLMSELEEDKKKLQDRAKEFLGRDPDLPKAPTESISRALKMARDELKKERRKAMGQAEDEDEDEDGVSEPKSKKMSSADKAREAAAAEAAGGRPRLPGDKDVTHGELGDLSIESSSSTATGPLTVEVTSTYNKEQSDPPMRKHCFQYTIRITNNSDKDVIQLLGRRFEIQTVGSSMKDVVQGEGVTGRQPILKPGEVFEYTSTAPLSVRPIGTTIIAARMRGEYRYITLADGQDTATPEQVEAGGDTTAELGTFHFIFPPDQQVKPFRRTEDDEDEDDEDEDDDDVVDTTASSATSTAPSKTPSSAPASSLPGDKDMQTGDIDGKLNDSSDSLTEGVRVQVTSSYRPERSDAAMEKHCFAYNIRITNESDGPIQLVSRRFEIQTIGSASKDVVQGPGVTGRQPVLKPGESFEYTSTAPLSVKPMMEKTPVVARMQGEYNFVRMGDDGATPISSTPLQAKLGQFHFILPALDIA